MEVEHEKELGLRACTPNTIVASVVSCVTLGGGAMKEDRRSGSTPDKDTHGKRSSSMSFALRWKHENLRLIVLSATDLNRYDFHVFGVVVRNGCQKRIRSSEWTRNHCGNEAMGPATPTG